MPRVVVLQAYDRLPRREVRFSRQNIYLRDNFTCQYCGRTFARAQLNLDHVVPRQFGGLTTWTNVVCSCVACNSRKANRTPEQAKMRLHKPPVRPSWKPLYASPSLRIASWSKFVSEAYWNVELK